MLRTIILVTTIATLSGCAKRDNTHGEWVKADLRSFTITHIDTPKHFDVSVKDQLTGHIFNDIARTKWCSNHVNWRVGQTIDLKADYWRKPDGSIVFTVDDSYTKSKLCG